MSWMKIESPVYWAVFVAAFLAIAVWESLQPRRRLSFPTDRRWGRHAILLAISGAALTALLRVSPIVIAASAANNPYGILNRAWLPLSIRCFVTIVLLDLVRYAMHRGFHSFFFLWRIHEVHHSDPDFDVSTGARFHPLEVVGSQAVYFGVIMMLAPPPIAVFAAELIALVLNFFSHANASLPDWAERLIRNVFVTPDMHRIHHSEEVCEQSRNFGQTFPWWDRLFGTYLVEAAAGEKGLITGIKGLQNETSVGLGFMLSTPFVRRTESQADPVLTPGP